MQETADSLSCRVCRELKNRGSSHEQVAYKVFDSSQYIQQYAVEAYTLKGQYICNGQTKDLGQHPWDIATAPPLKILAEVQGEQHDSKQYTQENNLEEDLSDRSAKDKALAAAAVERGYSVLWLQCEPKYGRKKRWAKLLQQAVQDAEAGMQPKLYAA